MSGVEAQTDPVPDRLRDYFNHVTERYSEWLVRQGEIISIPFDESRSNECHDNALRFVQRFGGEVVPGWLLVDMSVTYLCTAHSIVRLTDGTLADVTLDGVEIQHAGVFVPHQGNILEYTFARANRALVQWPPVTR